MPLYEISHTCVLDPEQQEKIAEDITDLHCTTFSAPAIFVNVIFHRYDFPKTEKEECSKTVFVGGKKHQLTNFLTAHLRPRPNNHTNLNHITTSLLTIWDSNVQPTHSGSITDPKALHSVFLYEDIAAGAEQGFVLPIAGNDDQWAKENLDAFEERSARGDEGMRALVETVKGKLEGKH